MLAVLFTAAALFAVQTDVARSVVTDVCVPFAAGEGASQDALDFLGFEGPADGETRDLRTGDEAYLLRISSDDGADSGDVRRTCVLTARRGGLDGIRNAIRRPLEQAGFTADAAQPADRPIWMKGGVSVSIRQNEGRATIVRINYSSLDEEASR